MTVAFISGPYRAGTLDQIHRNIEAAREVACHYWKRGYAVVCPHLNSAYMDGLCPDGVWLYGYQEILRRCDLVVMLPGWTRSAGAVREHDLAVLLEKEIVYA